MAAHESAREGRESFVIPARLAVAVGMGCAEPLLPAPARDAQILVPYDDDAQQVPARAFEVALAERAERVDTTHLTTAPGSGFPLPTA